MKGNDKARLGRRALLAAGAAGVAAVGAEALAPASVLAGSGNGANVQVGYHNEGTAPTVVAATGDNGFRGQSDVGDGLVLVGESSALLKSGVYGYTKNLDGFGVFGRNTLNGSAGYLGGKQAAVKRLVSDPSSVGVIGESTDPVGVGVGVGGVDTARSTYGGPGSASTAAYGGAPTDLKHRGLLIAGRVEFVTRSGTLTIAMNRSSVSTTQAALSSSSMVLATLQSNRAGLYIQAAAANSTTGKITIYLNEKVTAATKVAYFALN